MKSKFDRPTNYNEAETKTNLFSCQALDLSSDNSDVTSPNVEHYSLEPSQIRENALHNSELFSLAEYRNSEQCLRTCLREKASQGNYPLAISLLDELIALCPNNAADYNNRGLMYFRNNQIIEALCDLSYALEINPNLDSAYNNRANCHAAQGDLAEAISDYDLALDLNPANLRAWINQGITFRELKLYDLAIENFDIALILGDAWQERIYAERGRAYHLREDWNCAAGDYQKALDILLHRPKLAKYQQKVTSWLNELLDPLINNGLSAE